MIVIVNYNMGNVKSIYNMLKKIDIEATVANNAKEIELAEKLIIPGVGKFDAGMSALESLGLDEAIRHVADKGRPILGICLGMQLLGINSEEGAKSGLGLLSFKSVKFNQQQMGKLKVPHMGWNVVTIKNENNPLCTDLKSNDRFYFVHSFHAMCEDEQDVLMECEYGYVFTAAVARNNIFGVQFHPEKSHKFGMRLLENFALRC